MRQTSCSSAFSKYNNTKTLLKVNFPLICTKLVSPAFILRIFESYVKVKEHCLEVVYKLTELHASIRYTTKNRLEDKITHF